MGGLEKQHADLTKKSAVNGLKKVLMNDLFAKADNYGEKIKSLPPGERSSSSGPVPDVAKITRCLEVQPALTLLGLDSKAQKNVMAADQRRRARVEREKAQHDRPKRKIEAAEQAIKREAERDPKSETDRQTSNTEVTSGSQGKSEKDATSWSTTTIIIILIVAVIAVMVLCAYAYQLSWLQNEILQGGREFALAVNNFDDELDINP